MRYPWIHEIEDDVPLSECAYCPDPILIADESVWWPDYSDGVVVNRQAHQACWRENQLAVR